MIDYSNPKSITLSSEMIDAVLGDRIELKRKDEASAPESIPPTNKEAEPSVDYTNLLTSQLIARHIFLSDAQSMVEFHRRMDICGFGTEKSKSLYENDADIISKHDKRFLLEPDYIKSWCISLDKVNLKENPLEYLLSREFTTSEWSKFFDELNWHSHNSQNKELADGVWQEISRFSSRGKEPILNVAVTMLTELGWDPKEAHQYLLNENQILSNVRWEYTGKTHPYAANVSSNDLCPICGKGTPLSHTNLCIECHTKKIETEKAKSSEPPKINNIKAQIYTPEDSVSEGIYKAACSMMDSANTASEFMAAANKFDYILQYKDADALAVKCRNIAKEKRAETEKPIAGNNKPTSENKSVETAPKSAVLPSLEKLATQSRQSAQWEKQGLCKHCGGKMAGLFTKKCKSCGKTKNDPVAKPSEAEVLKATLSDIQNKRTEEISAVESKVTYLNDGELLKIFAEYFSSDMSKEFITNPNSPKFKAYFEVVNAATLEMLNNPKLYNQATKREQAELAAMCNNRVPGLTNSLICGLIFSVGKYAVVPSTMLCVDFAAAIPNCIAVYLLLTAQKLPADNRKQVISVGDGVNKQAFEKAMNTLKVCDPNWNFNIFQA